MANKVYPLASVGSVGSSPRLTPSASPPLEEDDELKPGGISIPRAHMLQASHSASPVLRPTVPLLETSGGLVATELGRSVSESPGRPRLRSFSACTAGSSDMQKLEQLYTRTSPRFIRAHDDLRSQLHMQKSLAAVVPTGSTGAAPQESEADTSGERSVLSSSAPSQLFVPNANGPVLASHTIRTGASHSRSPSQDLPSAPVSVSTLERRYSSADLNGGQGSVLSRVPSALSLQRAGKAMRVLGISEEQGKRLKSLKVLGVTDFTYESSQHVPPVGASAAASAPAAIPSPTNAAASSSGIARLFMHRKNSAPTLQTQRPPDADAQFLPLSPVGDEPRRVSYGEQGAISPMLIAHELLRASLAEVRGSEPDSAAAASPGPVRRDGRTLQHSSSSSLILIRSAAVPQPGCTPNAPRGPAPTD